MSISIFTALKYSWRTRRTVLLFRDTMSAGLKGFYDTRGVVQGRATTYYNFVIIPGFKTPEWAKGAVMYQIYVDQFL